VEYGIEADLEKLGKLEAAKAQRADAAAVKRRVVHVEGTGKRRPVE
jgi:hypothetical protein